MNNVLVLAYLGDCIYELYIRNYLISLGINKVNTLQKEAIKFVSAKSQCKYVSEMLENNFLTQEEQAVFYRGRNYKSYSHPKNTDIITYKFATGLEAVIGYLSLEKKEQRIEEIMNHIIEGSK